MRLIHTRTLEFKEFVGRSIPPYVILSHTWGDGEISFQEYEAWLAARTADPTTPEPKKSGFLKIKEFCNVCYKTYLVKVKYRFGENLYSIRMREGCLGQDHKGPAASEKLPFDYEHVNWVWVDTCSIDKKSSAELSEAINSMYTWYQRSLLCIAYLVDVTLGLAAEISTEQFSASRWFTRGWTLQELLAPIDVHFYDRQWRKGWERGQDRSQIATITKIDEKYLRNRSGPTGFHEHQPEKEIAATKFSWAARRQTTRTEDQAYCLMGLFGVNMPLLYGEGYKAFSRLQEEIIRTSYDHSILTWCTSNKVHPANGVPVSAQWPSVFSNTWAMPRDMAIMATEQLGTWKTTVHGLKVTLLCLLPDRCEGHPLSSRCFLGVLNLETAGGNAIGIYLSRKDRRSPIYVRAHTNRIEVVPKGLIHDSRPVKLLMEFHW